MGLQQISDAILMVACLLHGQLRQYFPNRGYWPKNGKIDFKKVMANGSTHVLFSNPIHKVKYKLLTIWLVHPVKWYQKLEMTHRFTKFIYNKSFNLAYYINNTYIE